MVVPVERLRLSCCTALPEERLLPEKLPEEERTCEEEEEPELLEELPEEEVLPLLRVVPLWLEVDRVEPPPVERVWATISGAMSMARAIIMETA